MKDQKYEKFLAKVYAPGTEVEQKRRAEAFVRYNSPNVVASVVAWGRRMMGR